jgi:pyruvate-formate lyase-activating enzyme
VSETADPHGIDKVFCHLPWTSLCAHMDGVYARCCVDSTGQNNDQYHGTRRPDRLVLAEDAVGCSPHSVFAPDNPDRVLSLEEAFNSPAMRRTRLAMLAGEPVIACRDCYERERLAGDSYRLQMTRQDRPAPGVDACRSLTDADGRVDGFPSYLDLRMGNHCNLRCVMCGVPTSSSIVQRSDDTWLRRSLDPYTDDEQFWRSLRDNLASIESLYFAGGEPLMLRAHQRVLELFIERGRAEHVSLTYTTNLTRLPPPVLALWPSFRSVALEASCDGIGSVFELVRAGARWDDFVRNVERVRNLVSLSLHVSPQRDNVLGIADVVHWALSHDLPIHVSNVFRQPAELSLRNLPAGQKQEARPHLAALASELAEAGHHKLASDVRGVLSYLESPPNLPGLA